VFVLFSFAAPAQTSIAAYYLDDLDCFGETTQQSTMPAQIIATEPTIGKLGEAMPEADGIAITGPNDAKDVPVGAIQPSDENSTVEYSTRSDDKVTADDTIEQSTMHTQIIATEPTIETLGKANLNEADDVAITGINGAEDVPVGAIQPNDESSTAKYSTLGDDKLTVDDTVDQGAIPPQIIAAEPTLEKLGEAKLNEADASRLPSPTMQRMFRSGRFSPTTKTRP
jgi:hypothetical protein